MKNGSTFLFHFEPNKKILIQVFDSTHKEIAKSEDDTKNLDIHLIEYAVFKGLYDINGEAVLFIDQDRNGKHELIMLRYNCTSGKLIEDRLVGQSESENRRIKYYVMKNKEDDNYSVLFCMDKRHPKQTDMFLVFFNKNHESVREIQLPVSRKKFDNLKVLGAEAQTQGILVAISLDKMDVGGLFGTTYNQYIQFFYIQKGDTIPETRLVQPYASYTPLYTLSVDNPLAGTLYSILFSYSHVYYKYGLGRLPAIFSATNFFLSSMNGLYTNQAQISTTSVFHNVNDLINSNQLNEIPVKLFTDEMGSSTIISQTDVPYGEKETLRRYAYQDYFGWIDIAQFDYTTEKTWENLLPLMQYCKSYQHFYPIKTLGSRWQEQKIFDDVPDEVYNRQFFSFNAYCKDKNFYIIFNDYNRNFTASLENPGDTVYGFNNTNASYYKISPSHHVSRHYLYGLRATDNYKASFIEGAAFDEQRGVYASVVQYYKGDNVTLRMGWAYLE